MDATKRTEDVVTVDVDAAKDLLSSGHRYLDVRTNEEFNKGHIDNALNVPYMFITQQGHHDDIRPRLVHGFEHSGKESLSFLLFGKVKNSEFLTQVSSIFVRDDHLVVGCNSGGRSIRACADLLNSEYKHVTNMGGGYSAWVDKYLDKSAQEFKTSCKFRP